MDCVISSDNAGLSRRFKGLYMCHVSRGPPRSTQDEVNRVHGLLKFPRQFFLGTLRLAVVSSRRTVRNQIRQKKKPSGTQASVYDD